MLGSRLKDVAIRKAVDHLLETLSYSSDALVNADDTLGQSSNTAYDMVRLSLSLSHLFSVSCCKRSAW